MRIAVVSSNVFSIGNGGLTGYGGLEHIAWLCADGLAKKGHDVTLIAPEGSRLDNGSVITTGPPGQWNERMGYNNYVNELHKFDAIVDHSWQKHSYLAKMQGRTKAPVLGVLHAPCNTMYQSLPPVEKPCFVCISQDQASHFEALHNRPAKVCYNGIDLDYYKSMSIPRTDRFLFLARFSSVKGPDIAIEACRQAGVGLDLVGDTSITQEPEFFQKCQSMCDGKQIRMVGPAKRGECVWWYSQAFAFVHPNQRFKEPFGLAPVEAMACGLPVICWDNGAMRETVRHGETGFLVKSLGQMIVYIKVLLDKTEHGMKVMRENCQDWSKQFSVENMVDRYNQLCHEAIEGGW